MDIHDLSFRANVNVYTVNGKHIVVYEDHRYLLNVLYTLKLTGDLIEPVNLIYFDYHDDALRPSKHQVTLAKKIRKKTPPINEFWRFVEFDLGSNDDDWLLMGMELGLIKDAVLIGAIENQNLSDLQNGYKDHLKMKHNVYSISHLWHSLDDRGVICDNFIKSNSNEVREILGFNTINNYRKFTRETKHPFVLDIDCDVFSTEILGETKAWPRERMIKLFDNYIDVAQMTARDFTKQLIERANIITICKESGCCGGIKESNAIFENINDLFFDGAICK